MRAKYVYEFSVQSEIKMASGDWRDLTFQRGTAHVRIGKPVYKGDAYFSEVFLKVLSGGNVDSTSLEAGGIIADVSMSVVRMEFECEEESANAQDDRALTDHAVEVLGELLSWVRVLTRQYWLGYKSRDYLTVRSARGVVQGDTPRFRGHSAFGWAFPYGRSLDESGWLSIGGRLARGVKPPTSELFFCDALVDVLQGDMAQAVIGLGVCCELEMQDLVEQVLAQKSEEFQRIFREYCKYPFSRSFRVVEDFGGEPFSRIDEEASRLVNVLYDMRGRAAHRGECCYEVDGEKHRITRGDMARFVEAVEKLFAWSAQQRGKLCPLGAGQAPGDGPWPNRG